MTPLDKEKNGGLTAKAVRGSSVEVLELALHDDTCLVMGARDSKGEAGEPQVNG